MDSVTVTAGRRGPNGGDGREDGVVPGHGGDGGGGGGMVPTVEEE
jgi:hypothetical protein